MQTSTEVVVGSLTCGFSIVAVELMLGSQSVGVGFIGAVPQLACRYVADVTGDVAEGGDGSLYVGLDRRVQLPLQRGEDGEQGLNVVDTNAHLEEEVGKSDNNNY